MRRYQLHPSPGSGVDAVVVGWDPDRARYALDLSYADGRSNRRHFDQLRELITPLEAFDRSVAHPGTLIGVSRKQGEGSMKRY